MKPPQTLHAAADLIQQVATKAPVGPYQLGPEPGYYRQVLGRDGDPFAHVRDWPGGIGFDYGEAHHNAAHIILWDRSVAMGVAAWLHTTAHAWPRDPGAFTSTPTASAARKAALDLAHTLLERKDMILKALKEPDDPDTA